MEKTPAEMLDAARDMEIDAASHEKIALRAFYEDDVAKFDHCMRAAARNRYEAAMLRANYYKAAANRVGARID